MSETQKNQEPLLTDEELRWLRHFRSECDRYARESRALRARLDVVDKLAAERIEAMGK